MATDSLNPHDLLEFGPFQLFGDGRLLHAGRPVALAPKERAVLRALVDAGGRVVTKDELLARAWADEDVSESSLTRCMHTLRNQLGDGARAGECIETVYGLGYRLTLPVLRAPSRPRLLVLPFEPDPTAPVEPERCDRVGEQVIEQLARYQGRGLTVIARGRSRRQGQDPRPADELAREVDAGFVLNGGLATRGGRLTLSVGLVAVQDGERLLVRTFERDEGALRALPSDVAAAVAGRLPLRVSAGRDPRLVAADETTPRVYETYLEARMLFRVRTPERMRRAVALYEQAIAWDPRFAPAYVGLADCISASVFMTAVARDEGLPKMERLLDEATAIDPEAPGLAVLRAATRSAFHWDFAAAEPLFREALERDVADSAGLNFYARHLLGSGRPERAAEVVRTLLDLDPLQGVSHAFRGFALFCARQWDEALAEVRRGLELEASAVPLGYHCIVAGHLGWREEALASARRLLDTEGTPPILAVTAADVFARAGDESAVRRVIEQAEGQPGWPAPTHTAVAAAALGDTDGAVRWLERALALRCVWLPMVRCDPRLDAVRGDPRVRAVFEGVRPQPEPGGASGDRSLSRGVRRSGS